MQYDKDGRPIIDPEIVTDEKYQRAYSEKAFLAKLPRVARRLGRAALTQILRLYYVLMRKDLPGKTRVIILGVLGYFVLPVDLLPDIMPIVGFTDDLGLLVAAFAAASQYMDDDVKAKADAKVNSLLGPEQS